MALKDLLDLLPFRVRYLLGLIPPIAGGSPDGEGEGDGEGNGEGDGGAGGSGDGDGGKEGGGDAGDEDGDAGDGEGDGGEGEGDEKETVESLRKRLRLAERQGKAASKRDKAKIAKLETDLKKRQDADKTEHEKAIEAAKEEGRVSALAESQKERRSDRLESAVIKLASKGLKIGDDEQVKFADKGALVLLQRGIESGDIDASDIFDDSDKVRDDGLREAVGQLLEDEDWLIVRPESKGQTRATESDAGKGGTGAKALEEMSPDDHLKQIQGRT